MYPSSHYHSSQRDKTIFLLKNLIAGSSLFYRSIQERYTLFLIYLKAKIGKTGTDFKVFVKIIIDDSDVVGDDDVHSSVQS